MATMVFGPLEIAFEAGVLEPRPWTIEQARWGVDLSATLPEGAVLELCCGAGQIGLVVAIETDRTLVQVDDEEVACAFARRNADAAGVVAEVRRGAMEDVVADGERFALVLADPPYVPTAETEQHPADPAHAIDGGADGLVVARRCVALAERVLLTGGALLVQLGGAEQADRLAAEHPDLNAETRSYGPDRAVLLLR